MKFTELRRIAAVAAAAGMLGSFKAAPALANDALDLAMSLPTPTSTSHSSAMDGTPERSYRVTLRSPRLGTVTIIADWEHARYKAISQDGSATTVSYAAGSMVYQRDPAGKWIKMDSGRVAQAAAPSREASAKPLKTSPERPMRQLPDRIIHGVRMGAYSYEVPASKFDAHATKATSVTVVCLTDKASGRLRSCSAGNVFTASFDHYNDPSNTVVVPAAALRAEEIR